MSPDQSAPLVAERETANRTQRSTKRGWGGWIAGAALAAFTLFFIANARVALDPRVANPNVRGRPRPVRFAFGLDYIRFLDGATVVALHCVAAGLHQRLATESGQSGDVDVLLHLVDRVAGPDHELVAVRGLQPRPHPLAGVLAAGVVVADRRTVRGIRLRDVLFRPLLPGGLDRAQTAGQIRTRRLSCRATRWSAWAWWHGDRLRHGCVAGEHRSSTGACTSTPR